MTKTIKSLASGILCCALLSGSLVYAPSVSTVNAVDYAETYGESVVAVVDYSQLSPELVDTLADFGLTEYNVDELLVVESAATSRGSSVNELKVVQENGDEREVSYLMAFDENMVQMDYVTYESTSTRASTTLTVTDADCRFTVTANFTDISRSAPTAGRFFRPRSISMSYTTSEDIDLDEVTLSLQAEGIRCDSDFYESEPYDGEYVYYIESTFRNVAPNRTISSSTVRPSGSGYVKYSGQLNSGVWATVEGETSDNDSFGFTRPMHTGG